MTVEKVSAIAIMAHQLYVEELRDWRQGNRPEPSERDCIYSAMAFYRLVEEEISK